MAEMKSIPTVCPYCGVGCGLLISTCDGRVIGLEYQKENPVNEGALCPKGNACLEVVYHNDRLLYPQKRENGRFVRISWEEALEMAAKKLSHLRSQHGPDALGFLASAKATNEDNYVFQKLARMIGTNNVDHCARL